MPDFVDALDAARAGRDRRRPAAAGVHRLPSGAADRRARRADAASCSAASPRTRSRAPTWCPNPPSRSASCAPSRSCATPRCRSSCRAARSCSAPGRRCCEVIYLVFNEGYTATAGEDWMRPALAQEALRLGAHAGRTGAARGRSRTAWSALLELQSSRTAARTDAQGRPVLLADQDRGRWDRLLIRRGLAALERAGAPAAARGPYALQAAIAACHARAPQADATDWQRIAALYARACARSRRRRWSNSIAPSRSAWPMVRRPASRSSTRLLGDKVLQRYQWLPRRARRPARQARARREAREAFLAAAGLAGNAREQALLRERAAALSA